MSANRFDMGVRETAERPIRVSLNPQFTLPLNL